MTQSTNYNEKYTQLTAELRKCIRLRKSCDTIRFAYNSVGYDVGDRTDRIRLIDAMTRGYMTEHAAYNQRSIDRWEDGGSRGERPKSTGVNAALLESLADAILDEELTDTNEHKVSQTEYPFLSESQMKLRDRRESLEASVATYGADRVDYRKPMPRARSDYEDWYVNDASRRVNRERSSVYRRDTTAGRTTTYNLRDTGGELAEEFTQCRGVSDVWRGFIEQSAEVCDV